MKLTIALTASLLLFNPASQASTLLEAVESGDTGALIERVLGGESVDGQNGPTPLSVAVSRGDWETTVTLLELGADPNRTPAAHSTPLHRAVTAGRIDLVDALIAHGAAVDGIDPRAPSPLMRALASPAMVGALLARGANPNYQMAIVPVGLYPLATSPLTTALQEGHHASVEALLAAGAAPTAEALILAAALGRTNAVGSLLNAGADVQAMLDRPDGTAINALWAAAQRPGNGPVIALLEGAGAGWPERPPVLETTVEVLAEGRERRAVEVALSELPDLPVSGWAVRFHGARVTAASDWEPSVDGRIRQLSASCGRGDTGWTCQAHPHRYRVPVTSGEVLVIGEVADEVLEPLIEQARRAGMDHPDLAGLELAATEVQRLDSLHGVAHRVELRSADQRLQLQVSLSRGAGEYHADQLRIYRR